MKNKFKLEDRVDIKEQEDCGVIAIYKQKKSIVDLPRFVYALSYYGVIYFKRESDIVLRK